MGDEAVYSYARKVVDGEIIACKTIRRACERHLKDLITANERGLCFDPKAAEHAINFFKYCRHSKGEWAGAIFKPEPWEQFIIGSIFGWKRLKDKMRRFRTALIFVPRKNGKTTLLAVAGNYLFVADNEAGAEIYSAAKIVAA